MIRSQFTLIFIFLFCAAIKVFPATETKNTRLGNGQLIVGQQITVYDEKYFETPTWWTNYNSLQHEALVTLGLDEAKHMVYPVNFATTINFTTKAFDKFGNSTTYSGPVYGVLTLTYTSQGIYYDKSAIRLGNYAKLEITVTGLQTINLANNSVISNPAELFLEGEVRSSRYYKFSPNLIPSILSTDFNYNTLTKTCPGGNCVTDLDVYWDYIPGAEDYELEWTWVNDYPSAPLTYNFMHDGTRITTNKNSFKIPVVYEKGYLLFRVRGIGQVGPLVTDRVETYWSTQNISPYGTGLVSAFPANMKFQINTTNSNTSDQINWSATMTFAEEGKKGTGVNYLDGLLMARQSQAKLNTDEKIIAQQTIYDFQGRPAISVLPAPVNINYFDYQSKLSANGSNLPYTKLDFDDDLGTCQPSVTDPMSPANSVGAAKYYSASNTNQTGSQGYLPDAKNYPFVQVEYAPDKSGRVITQSMPGDAHKLGNNHETKFIYSNPGDQEILRLFGSEAGNVKHYDKNMVIDANGQISATYKNLEGKVVATALMGDKPNALDGIEDYTNNDPLKDEHTKYNIADGNNYTIISSKKIYVETANSVQTFKYEFTPLDFTDNVCTPLKCFDCIYEIEISIKDECGTEVYKTYNGQNINTPIQAVVGAPISPANVGNCDSPSLLFELANPPISVTFPAIGNYKVLKTLKVSNIPISQYITEYLQNNACVKSLNQILAEQTNAIDFTTCGTDCASCSTSVNNYIQANPGQLTQPQINELLEECGELCSPFDPCESSRQAMINDFFPGTGQYAKYDGGLGNFTGCSDPASIFYNTGPNALGIYFTGVTFPVSSYAFIPVNGVYTYVNPNALTPQQFIDNFKPEWAELYLQYHPEYAYLEFCNLNKQSDLYDFDMLQTNSFDEACTKGFIKPLAGIVAPPVCTNACANVNDPFFAAGGFGLTANSIIGACNFVDAYANLVVNTGFTYNNFMLYAFNNLYPIPTNGPPNPLLPANIYNIAKFQAGNNNLGFGCDPCTKDNEWQNFRALYLTYKMRLVAQAKTDFVMLKTPALNLKNTGFNGCMINSGMGGATTFTPSNPNNQVSINIANLVSAPALTSLNFLPFFNFIQNGTNIQAQVYYTYMGYPVSKAPNVYNAGCNQVNTFYNPYGQNFCGNPTPPGGDALQPCSFGNAPNFYTKVARFPQLGFDINNLITQYNLLQPAPNNIMPLTPVVIPPPNNLNANYCNDMCTSYADQWINKLKACSTAVDIDSPSYSAVFTAQVKAQLIDVCKRGCDGTNPFGSSTVNPANAFLYPPAPSPNAFNSFAEVITFYFGPETADCSVDLISGPKVYNAENIGMNNPATLDTCGCNKVLLARYEFANNPLPPGVTTVQQYFQYKFGNTISNFSEIECKCLAAWGNNVNNWYAATQVPTNWTGPQQAALFNPGPTYVPAFLDCPKPCLPCSTVVNEINAYVVLHPTYPASNNYPMLLSNHLNNFFGYHLGFDDYMDFYKKCNNAINYPCPNQVDIANKLKNIVNQWISFYNASLPNGPFVLPSVFNNSPNSIPSIFNSPGTPDFLTCGSPPPAVPGYTGNTLDPNLGGVFVDGNAVIFQNVTLGNLTCAKCTLALDVLSLNSIGSNPMPQNQLPIVTGINFNPPFASPQPGIPSYNFYFQLNGVENLNYPGYISCLPNIPPCNNSSFKLCDRPLENTTTVKDDCISNMINNAYNNALYLYEQQINSIRDQFTRRYKDKCMKITDEKFERTYNLREYHYTLYYYDQSGNLVKTVPPKGVTILAPAQYNTFPAHTYTTGYTYQSYNAPLTSISPDETNFTDYAYDKTGRIVASSNAKQKLASGGPYCSYTLYDVLGRIIEVGEVKRSIATIQNDILTNSHVSGILSGPLANRTQIIKTYYDQSFNPVVNVQFLPMQNNLRNRVASVTYEAVEDNNPLTYNYGTHYSYDEHGNVTRMIQENPFFKGKADKYFTLDYEYDLISGNVNQVLFQKNKIDAYYHKYEYDQDNRLHLVLTSRNGVLWDRDAKYFYYEHGPLARKELGEQKVNAEDYAYTIQGWIKAVNSNMLAVSTDIGKDGGTGGFSAGVTDIHKFLGKDAFGYNLNYYKNATYSDYSPIKTFNGGTDLNLLASTSNISVGAGAFDLQTDAPDLYNGNITSMVTSFIDKDLTNTVIDGTAFPQLTAYKYDQLHRIKQMKAYRDFNFGSNNWNTLGVYDNSYESNFTYDKNGNILTHNRNGASANVKPGSVVLMDNMSYIYEVNGNLKRNRLIGVNDAATGSAYTTDIKGLSAAVAGNNATYDYDYDEIGNLKKDVKEFISDIEWTVDRKVKSITRNAGPMFSAGKNMPNIYFEYDANRQRVRKTERFIQNVPGNYIELPQETWIDTYYVRDASGNVMATYTLGYTNTGQNAYTYTVAPQEYDLYGSSRLASDNKPGSFIGSGTYNSVSNIYIQQYSPMPKKFTHQLGSKNYEQSNHLGNVITVISDRKLMQNGNTQSDFINFEGYPYTVTNQNYISATAIQQVGNSTSATSSGFTINVSAGTVVNANAWVKNPNGSGVAVLRLEYRDASNAVLQTQNMNITLGTNSYTQYAVGATAPANAVEARINLINANVNAVYIDDFGYSASAPGNIYFANYTADIKETHDYYPFGYEMPGRTIGTDYSFNFTGKRDDKWNGNGSSYQDFGARMYDARLGRFMSMDAHRANYPSHSPFNYVNNDPISLVDRDGNDWGVTITKDPATGKNTLKLSLKAAVIITANGNIKAADAAKIVASNLKTMIQETALFYNLNVDIDIDIRGITTTAEIQVDDHVIEFLNPSVMPKSSKGVVMGQSQLYGKYIAFDINTYNNAINGSDIKTIPHELFHSAGLRHPFESIEEGDYDYPLEMMQLNREKYRALNPDGLHSNLMNYDHDNMPQVLNPLQLGIVLENSKKKLLNQDNVPKTDIGIRNISKLAGKRSNHKTNITKARAKSGASL